MREVAVALEVVAPRLAPERLRDLATRDRHGRHRLPAAGRVLDRSCRIRASPGGALAWLPAEVASGPAHGRSSLLVESIMAVFRSSATSVISSASLNSVSLISEVPSNSCRDTERFPAIMASIFSSTVPRQTSLCTSTLRRWPMRNARSVA